MSDITVGDWVVFNENPRYSKKEKPSPFDGLPGEVIHITPASRGGRFRRKYELRIHALGSDLDGREIPAFRREIELCEKPESAT